MDDFIFVLEPDFEKFLVQYRRQQEGKKVLYSSLPDDAGEVFDYNEYKKQGKHFLDANNALIDPSLREPNFFKSTEDIGWLEEYLTKDLGIKILGTFYINDDYVGTHRHFLIPVDKLKNYYGGDVESNITEEDIANNPKLAYLREDPELKLFLVNDLNIFDHKHDLCETSVELCCPASLCSESTNNYQLDFNDKFIKQNILFNYAHSMISSKNPKLLEVLSHEIRPNELSSHKTPEMKKIASLNYFMMQKNDEMCPVLTFDRDANSYVITSFGDNWLDDLSLDERLLNVNANNSLEEIFKAYTDCLVRIGEYKDHIPSLDEFKHWQESNRSVLKYDEYKYFPKTKEELNKLVDDPEVNLGEIDTTKITDMSELFQDSKRTDFSGIEKWNVSNVTSMGAMFAGCHDFNQDISSWDVSSVEIMFGMFADCRAFNQSLNAWDVSKVTNMFNLFYGCENFNQPLDMWNVSNVISMQGMFEGCKNFNQPLNDWDVSNVKDTSQMFDGCENFNQPLNDWNVSKVEDMYGMFAYCTSFNQPLNDWDVSNAKLLCDLFDHCEQFNQDLNDWVIREDCKVKGMFDGCNKQTYDNVKMIGFSKTQLQDLDPSEEENRFVKGFKEVMSGARKAEPQQEESRGSYIRLLH